MLIRLRSNLYVNTDQIIAVRFFESESEYVNVQYRLIPGNPDFIPGPCAIVDCVTRSYQITQSAARGLLEFLDVNESIVFDEDLITLKPDLKSQIAVMLRDTWKGATVAQLDAIFPDAGGLTAIRAAVDDLLIEHTLLMIPDPLDTSAQPPFLLYHASSSEAQTYTRKRNSLHFGTSGQTHCGFTANDILITTTLVAITCAECRESLGLNVTPSPDPLAEGEALPGALDPVVADTDSKSALKTES